MAKTKNSAEGENGDKSSSPTESTTASTETPSVVPPESDNISTRVGTRTKKAKVVFDPSDNYVPRKRVRKADLAPPEPPVGSSASKSDHLVPKSPSKSDALTDSSNGTASAKSRLALSPATVATTKPTAVGLAVTTSTSYSRPKVLGGGPSSSSLSSLSADGSRLLAGSVGADGKPADFIKREPNCDMCHKVEQQRRGFKLIDCSSCAFRAHSKCLRAHPVYQKFPIRINFRCFQCIECVVCGKSLRGGNLLFCCDCQNAFHANCHGPSNSDSPWVCKRCLGVTSPVKQQQQQSQRSQPEKQPPPVAERPESVENADDEAHQEFAGFSDNEIRKDSFSLSDSGPANDSSALQQEDMEDDDDEDEEEEEDDNHQEENEEEVDEEPSDQNDTTEENNDIDNDEEKFDPRLDNFEDIQNWSCEDVYRYFKHYFPDYAHLFKEQEIDGPSLVLMRKSDVLSGFGLKLGPAISLYQRIVMMQNNDRDFRLTWI